MLNLGRAYKQGFDGKVDLKITMHCYQKAADNGHPRGKNNLGFCLSTRI
jgi:TPR repeat protein